MCKSIRDTLVMNGVGIELYSIDQRMEPNDSVRLSENEGILICNFFGLLSRKKINHLVSKYRNVILDNTQCFFEVPVSGCYNLYSCRKFFGVNDGAYLIRPDMPLDFIEYERDNSSDTADFLLKSIEYGQNYAYGENLLNENRIDNTPIRKMSLLTQKILQAVDYENIQQIRKTNFRVYADTLSEINELDLSDYSNTPMIYPLLIKNNEIRNYLVSNKVYVSQWWKYLLKDTHASEWEKYLSKYLLPLPLDQRYNALDIQYISELILNFIKNQSKEM